MSDPNIYLDGNDKYEEFDITTPSTTTGAVSAAVALTLTVHYSLTWGGAAINAAVSKSLTEYSGKPGTYHATQLAASITTYLTPSSGERIFAVIMDSGGHVKESFDRFVVANR